jgi:putative ABC transport system permease protein
MLFNYLKIALRNLLRSKTYSFINILGLSVGIACCLMLALYIEDEVRYDKHHARLDDFYRIITQFETERGLDKLASTSPPITMAMWDEIPEVESAARVLNPPGVAQNLIRYQDKLFYEADGFIADSTFFDLFSYDLLEGNPKTALIEAQSVVLADHLARKLFGTESALDKTIHISQGGPASDYRVTGVYTSNHHSHIKPNFITSMTSAGWGAYIRTSKEGSTEWAGNNFVPGYLRLVPGHDKAAVEAKMNEVLVKHGAEAMKALGIHKTLRLEAVKDIYLRSDIGRSPRITYTYIIASIAIFILLIACINFMNLSTAKASKRATEMGIRKVLGAFRSSLMKQVLGEALVIVLISIFVSIILVQVALPFFNQLTGKLINLNSTSVVFLALAISSIAVITGILAGSYPAFYLSSFQPAQVLKGKAVLSNSRGWLRQSLVVFQFVVAITLACGMIVISQQLNFMEAMDLGFKTDARIVLPLRTVTSRKAYPSLKKQLLNTGNITQVSAANYVPGSYIWSDMMYYPDGGSMETAVMIRRDQVDAGFIELLKIPLVAGRSFTDNRASESAGKLIVNRIAAKKLGFEPEQIIGRSIYFDLQGTKRTFEVVGVVEDFHQVSPKEEITPVLFEIAADETDYDFAVMEVKKENFSATIASIETAWKETINDTPFEFSFLDQTIQKQYDEDRKVSSIITSFTFIAMAICCLGLYGLSSFMAERRVKEIGIRKVMGASVSEITGMMSQEFLKLIIIAFVLAVPLAWYGMTQWLEGFAYHVPISAWVFVIAGAAALFIALATVSFESLKAASANPVQSLRTE